MNQCPNCKASVDADARFCKNCAAPVLDTVSNNMTYGGTPSKRKTLMIGGIVLVALLLGGGITAVLLLTGSKSTNASTPGEAARIFFLALDSGDEAKSRNLIARTSRLSGGGDGQLQAIQYFKQRGGIESVTIVREREKPDNRADVRFDIKFRNGENLANEIKMVREDGIWKVWDL